ncbi:MAG TPA: hypothetical protein VGS41_13280, partial [Chthonomonadales bacterium]|nr:hypothetical protein [Chthonomonadales bacterium]
ACMAAIVLSCTLSSRYTGSPAGQSRNRTVTSIVVPSRGTERLSARPNVHPMSVRTALSDVVIPSPAEDSMGRTTEPAYRRSFPTLRAHYSAKRRMRLVRTRRFHLIAGHRAPADPEPHASRMVLAKYSVDGESSGSTRPQPRYVLDAVSATAGVSDLVLPTIDMGGGSIQTASLTAADMENYAW